MTTTETPAEVENPLARAAMLGPGFQANQAEADRLAAEEARIAYDAAGGSKGETSRAKVAAEDARAVAVHTAGMSAMADSYEADRTKAPSYADELEALEAGVTDPDVGPAELFARFEAYATALAVGQGISAHGVRGAVIAKGGAPGQYFGPPPAPLFGEVLERALSVRATNAAAEAVSAMHTRAQDAYGAAAK